MKERRKHRRASLELPLDVTDSDKKTKGFTAKTVNLSAGGFYCKVPFYIPVYTKLKISMSIPVSEDEREQHRITCEGMVVRTVPEKPEPGIDAYEIGCFFTDIDDFDRLIIEQYLAEKAFR